VLDEAQAILKKNREIRRTPKTNDHAYLLKGILREGTCGHMMTPYSSTGALAVTRTGLSSLPILI
jgi:hypothetical protein